MKFVLKKFDTPVVVTRLANVHYFDFTGNYHTFSDKHDFCELVYADNGWLDITSDRYNGRLSQRQMILHLAGDSHSLSCDRSIAPEVIIIGFECDCPRLREFSERPTTLSGELQKLLAEIIRESVTVFAPPYNIPNTAEMKLRENYPYGAFQMIKNLLEEFLIRLIRSSDKQTDALLQRPKSDDKNFIEAIKQYIEENLSSHITVSELCLLFNTNRTTLHNSFRLATGETPVTYINRRKIRLAKQLIREQNMNFTQISEELGFSSVHYFTRIFIQYEKLTPSQYAQMIKSRLNGI